MEHTLTGKGAATRQRIIDGAVVEVRAKGATAATLDSIRAASGTSKSQLFHYFRGGKAELLLAVAEHEADLVLAEQQPYLDGLAAPEASWAAWYAWRDAVVARYRRNGQHCPLSTLMNQLGRTEPANRRIVVDLLERWEAALAAGVGALRERGLVAADVDADRTAAALLAGIQGGVVVLLATGRIGHLEIAIDTAVEHLRQAAPAVRTGGA